MDGRDAPAPDEAGREVAELLDALGGRPRPAGSANEESARSHARSLLEAAGFVVREEPFSYSAFPGQWATSLSGVVAIGVVGVAGHFGAHGSPWAALSTLLAGTGAIAVTAVWLARRGVLGLPVLRRQGVNLVAVRGAGAAQALGQSQGEAGFPQVWLMGHLDSKSQPVPILVRAAAITASTILVLLGVILAVAQGLGSAGPGWWPPLSVLMVMALLPVAASVVGAQSDGAIDNASGCAAVLLAARMLPRDTPVGVLLTSAEELGLAGARAFTGQSPLGICINCDGVDDGGRWTAMYTGAAPAALLAALARAATGGRIDVTARRLLPGVLVDGVALADAGWQVITISHGSIGTLGRIHTSRDSRAALRGSAIPAAGGLIARIVQEVR